MRILAEIVIGAVPGFWIGWYGYKWYLRRLNSVEREIRRARRGL